jgi:hypothetical protein
MTATFIRPFTGFIEKTFVITEFELRKLRHDFTELITRALQPALWLLIFGHPRDDDHSGSGWRPIISASRDVKYGLCPLRFSRPVLRLPDGVNTP